MKIGLPRAMGLAAVACLATGCGLVEPTACTDEARPGLVVHVRDSVTDTPVGAGAVLEIRDGAYAETPQQPVVTGSVNTYPFYGAYERAGSYALTVRKAGYLTWSRAGVRVTKDECHVRTVELTARLKRAP